MILWKRRYKTVLVCLQSPVNAAISSCLAIFPGAVNFDRATRFQVVILTSDATTNNVTIATKQHQAGRPQSNCILRNKTSKSKMFFDGFTLSRFPPVRRNASKDRHHIFYQQRPSYDWFLPIAVEFLSFLPKTASITVRNGLFEL